MTSPHATWSYPTSVRFGAGRIAELPDVCRDAGLRRPLVVTDPVVGALATTGRALDALREAGFAPGLFDGTTPNPTGADLDACLAVYRDGGHDGVVAFGGGSALDLGKCAAFMAGQTRPVWDFEDVGDWWTRADADAVAPVVAVPTTAGTGSEVGRAGVLTNEATRTKKIIFHPRMLPVTVIADPELTVGMPPVITAGTGMDAFAHCLEAYSSPVYHPISAGIAVEGMRLVKEWLPKAYVDGADVEARGHMMSAAAMGAVAFQKGLGAIHALSHPVGALYDTHHGMTNAVVTPVVLRFNRRAIEARIVRLAAYLGLAPSFDAFTDFVMELRATLGVPERLREMKGGLTATAEDFDRIAGMAIEDPTAGGNPVELTREAARQLIEEAW